LNLFIDSSALAKRYVRESGTDLVLTLFDQAQQVLASRLTWLEVTAAVARIARTGSLSAPEAVLRALDDDFAIRISILEVSSAVISDARQLANRHELRAADSVQLATALTARSWHGADTRFLCSDRRLVAAAVAEELTAINPQGN